MAGSALLNSPPNTPQDVLIQKGMREFTTKFNPVKSLPYGPHRPSPDSPDDFSGDATLGLAITFLILLLVMTVGRFIALWWKRNRHFGLDDVFLLLAAPVAAAYVALTIHEFSPKKCAGRHMWFCTYADMNEIYLVRHPQRLACSPHLARFHIQTVPRYSTSTKQSSTLACTAPKSPFSTSSAASHIKEPPSTHTCTGSSFPSWFRLA